MGEDNSLEEERSVKLQPSTDVAEAREELRLLLKDKAILYSGAGQPIKLKDNRMAPWMFYSWGVTMSNRGAFLAARCLLDRLKDFKSTQLATFGYTGMPLLMACIMQSEGRYTGISIRDERKTYGTSRRIEGPIDKNIPVVVIDDSLSSGSAMLKAAQALEEEGFRVEGGVCLVHFPWRGGMERVQGLGYRMEAIFDIWRDLEMSNPEYVPGFKRAMPAKWGSERIENGLHPAHAARRAAEIFLSSGVVPAPPEKLDRDYGDPGGTFVSFRYKGTDHRLVRDGFWHFNPSDADPCRDVVLAAIKTVKASRGKLTLDEMKKMKIAVTFFGPFEKIPPGKLDFSKYGIVVRSSTYDGKMGGALPNTEVYTNETDQYRHARVINAKIGNYEPHEILRHELVKCVEPGEYWLPYGFPVDPASDWSRDDSIGTALTRRALEHLEAIATGGDAKGERLPDNLIPAPVFAVSVTLYAKGIVGCGVAWGGALDGCIRDAARTAWGDRRFAEKKSNIGLQDMSVSVSILHDREWLGQVPIKQAQKKMRRGLDSISVQKEKQTAIFLPVVPVYYNLSKEQVTRELLKKAKITKGPCIWSTYKTATWLRRGNRQWKVTFGFPDRTGQPVDSSTWKEYSQWMGSYIAAHLLPDGIPEYLYLPITNKSRPKGTAGRSIHALAALNKAAGMASRADWEKASLKGLAFCREHLKIEGETAKLELPGRQGGAMADCILLTALAASGSGSVMGDSFHRLAARVRSFFHQDGRITPMPDARGVQFDFDFFPGTALLSVASYAKAAGDLSFIDKLEPQFEWHRRRFRCHHPWGMVGWQTQAWSALYELAGKKEYADFVFEMADWAMDWQHEKTGAFLADLHPYGMSFLTLFFAEGIADAWRLAKLVGDERRRAIYARSCAEAIRFLNQILIHPEDTFCAADPNKSVGGVRGSVSTSEVRIDYVSHALVAVIKAIENL